MNDNVLDTIKKLLGITDEYVHFDLDIITQINSVLSILRQLGVKGEKVLVDESTTWSDIIPEGYDLELIKSFIYLKVRLLFDPPNNSFLVESINKNLAEFEWRINVEADR